MRLLCTSLALPLRLMRRMPMPCVAHHPFVCHAYVLEVCHESSVAPGVCHESSVAPACSLCASLDRCLLLCRHISWYVLSRHLLLLIHDMSCSLYMSYQDSIDTHVLLFIHVVSRLYRYRSLALSICRVSISMDRYLLTCRVWIS